MKSDFVKKGTERAPHRSLFNAAGYTDEELERPLIGVVNSFNEIVPGHMNLDKICEAVKKGMILGTGKAIHAHGTVSELKGKMPKPFAVILPKDFKGI